MTSPENVEKFARLAKVVGTFWHDETAGRARCHCGRFMARDATLCARHQRFADLKARLKGATTT